LAPEIEENIMVSAKGGVSNEENTLCAGAGTIYYQQSNTYLVDSGTNSGFCQRTGVSTTINGNIHLKRGSNMIFNDISNIIGDIKLEGKNLFLISKFLKGKKK
jgi:hypothetical protein